MSCHNRCHCNCYQTPCTPCTSNPCVPDTKVKVRKNKCGKVYVDLPTNAFFAPTPVSNTVASVTYTSTDTPTQPIVNLISVGPITACKYVELGLFGTLTPAPENTGLYTITINRGTTQVATISFFAGLTTAFAIPFTEAFTGTATYTATITSDVFGSDAVITNIRLSGTYM